MKSQLSTIDIHYLLKEFQVISDSKVEKIYQDNEDFYFLLYHSTNGKKILKISLPNFIYMSQNKFVPEEPPGFCTFLRKYLNGTRLKSIEQIGFDRILKISFESKEKNYDLIIEMLNPGNMILLEGNVIKGLYKSQRFKDRFLRGGIVYEFPKLIDNIFQMDLKQFSERMHTSDKETVVKKIAIDFYLGGMWAEEICKIAKISKDEKKVTEDQCKVLFDIISELKGRDLKPVVLYDENNKVIEVLPFKFETIKYANIIEFETYSTALDSVLSENKINLKQKEQKKEKTSKLNKVEKIIEAQEKQLKKTEKELDENQKKGEAIYENYQLIQDVLTQISAARKKHSWDEIKARLKDHKIIKNIDPKTGEIELELS